MILRWICNVSLKSYSSLIISNVYKNSLISSTNLIISEFHSSVSLHSHFYSTFYRVHKFAIRSAIMVFAFVKACETLPRSIISSIQRHIVFQRLFARIFLFWQPIQRCSMLIYLRTITYTGILIFLFAFIIILFFFFLFQMTTLRRLSFSFSLHCCLCNYRNWISVANELESFFSPSWTVFSNTPLWILD